LRGAAPAFAPPVEEIRITRRVRSSQYFGEGLRNDAAQECPTMSACCTPSASSSSFDVVGDGLQAIGLDHPTAPG
jgi:hypothetical protein